MTTLDEPSSSKSRTLNWSSVLCTICPLLPAMADIKNNGGQRTLPNVILTSLETTTEFHNKEEKRASNRPIESSNRQSKIQTKPPAKYLPTRLAKGPPHNQPSAYEVDHEKTGEKTYSEEDEDFCIIGFKPIARYLNRNNSIVCIECRKEMH